MIISFLLCVLIIAISIILLSVTILIKKNGKFPSTHIHDNEALKRQGIDCAITQDREARKKERR